MMMTHSLSKLPFLAFSTIVFLAWLASAQYPQPPYPAFRGIPGNYCKGRRVECCASRDDECTVPIMDTLCYCDMFCDRPDGGDCCPDFYNICTGQPPPVEVKRGECFHEGAQHLEGDRVQQNCQSCTCSNNQWVCDGQACLIQVDLLEKVQGQYSWDARKYDQFWGKTLDFGITFRLGTLYPERSVQNMNEILIQALPNLPERFDAREKWPNLISSVRDQGNCGSSWAFSTTAISADRLAIQSGGKYTESLSPQQLLSCNQHRQQGCNGGYLDRAWWYIRKYGVVSDGCYPYDSGITDLPGQCKIPKSQYKDQNIQCPSGSTDNRVYKMTPPYRVSSKEADIQTEIMINGPVQATFLVHEDFFMYSGGVYQHLDLAAHKGSQYQRSAYHSVRLLGWGTENVQGRPVKYWLAANSWGPRWGENGFFKILRGENHCQIESFVLGAWGKGSKRRRRKFKVKRHRKFRRF